jgi:hypothetical protein|tara:strand:+ start:79 stop:369 length:291 start_codon:yes stop_codon:yes gene_type:complete
MILETFLSLSLFITGGHLVDTNFGLHHYSDEDYKDLWYLENKKSITKHCTRHDKLETLKKVNRSREGGSQTDFQISDPYPIQDTPQQDTFNSQRPK